MQYALLIYPDLDRFAAMSEAEQQAVRAEYMTLLDDPHFVTGAQLQPVDTATSVRVVDGRALMTDGPFADTKEILGGIMLIEAADLDAATQVALSIPATRYGGAVEIRPTVVPG